VSKFIIHDHSNDGIDRRGFLNCMAWAGTGVLWTISGGPSSRLFGQKPSGKSKGDLTFVHISDSHIGFNKPANPDVTGTLQVAIDRINALDAQPDLTLHTGDLTHSAKPAEFDTLAQSLLSSKQKQIFYVPGEHDISVDDGRPIWSASEKVRKARVGTASIKRASTSSAWLTPPYWKAWASWGTTN
jgi:Icc protein